MSESLPTHLEKALVMNIIKLTCEKSDNYLTEFNIPEFSRTSDNLAVWKISLKHRGENYFQFKILGNKVEVEMFPVVNSTTPKKSILAPTDHTALTNALVYSIVNWTNGMRKISDLNSDWDFMFGDKSNKNNVDSNHTDKEIDTPLSEKEVDSLKQLINNLNSLINESKILSDEIKHQSIELNKKLIGSLNEKPTVVLHKLCQ